MFLRRVAGSCRLPCKEALQRVGGDSSIAELPRGTGGRGETLNCIAVLFRSLTDGVRAPSFYRTLRRPAIPAPDRGR